MNVTFEDGMQESIVAMFNMYADDDGIVRHVDSDEPVATFNGHEPIQASNVGGIVTDPNSETDSLILIRDNFSDICDYVRACDGQPNVFE